MQWFQYYGIDKMWQNVTSWIFRIYIEIEKVHKPIDNIKLNFDHITFQYIELQIINIEMSLIPNSENLRYLK